MTFKDQLEKANEIGLNVLDLRVALEVKDTIESSLYSDFQCMRGNAYNVLCCIIRDIYLKADREGFENEEQFINAIQTMRKSGCYKC